jgi:hypothetical protein
MSELSQGELASCIHPDHLDDWSPRDEEWNLVQVDEYDEWYDSSGMLMECRESR